VWPKKDLKNRHRRVSADRLALLWRCGPEWWLTLASVVILKLTTKLAVDALNRLLVV
jgi:hypothetical protein